MTRPFAESRPVLGALCGLLALAALPATGCGRGGRPGGSFSDRSVVFSVDEREVRLGDLRRFVRAASPSQAYDAIDDRTRSRLLDQMMEREILLQEARRRGLQVEEDEIRETIERMPDTPDEPGPPAKEADLRRDVEETLLIRRYRDEALLAGLRVSPEEVRAHYEAHPEIYDRDLEILIQQIFVESEDAARSAWDRLETGEDFLTVANQVSESPVRRSQRYISPKDLPPLFADALAKMKPGEHSGVLRSPGGYHILHLDAVREARKLTLEEATPEIQKHLLQEKAEARVQELVAGVKRTERFVFSPESLDFTYTPPEETPR